MYAGVQAAGKWLVSSGDGPDPSVDADLVRTLLDDPWLSLSTIALTQIGWIFLYAMTGYRVAPILLVVDLCLWVGRRRMRRRIERSRSPAVEKAGDILALLNVAWSMVVAAEVVLLMHASDLRALVLAMMLSVGERSYTGTLYAGFPRLTYACGAISTGALAVGLWHAFHPQLVVMIPMALALSVAFLFLNSRAHRNLIDAVRARQAAHRQSLTDPLTGLGNRLAMNERLRDMCEEAKLEERFGSLLYVDLDGFKLVNDRFGHAVGDQVLMEVGGRLFSCVRAQDIVCRLGGDEFVVLLREADEFSLHHLASNVVASIGHPIEVHPHPHPPIVVGASVGIAMLSTRSHTPAEVLAEADKALYAAKNTGKGRFVIAS